MTRAQFVSAVQRRLGFRSDLADEIVAESALAQQRLGRVAPYPWFLLYAFPTQLDTSNSLTLPDAYIAFAYEPYSIFFTDDPSQRLKLISMPDLKNDLQTQTDTVAARPQYAAAAGLTVVCNPPPDQTYAIQIYAYFDDTELTNYTDGQSNLWLKYAGEFLVLETARRIAVDSRDAELASFLAGEAQQARFELDRETVAKTEAGIERVIRETMEENSGRAILADTDEGD